MEHGGAGWSRIPYVEIRIASLSNLRIRFNWRLSFRSKFRDFSEVTLYTIHLKTTSQAQNVKLF